MQRQSAGYLTALGLTALSLCGVAFMHYLLWCKVHRLVVVLPNYFVSDWLSLSLKCLIAEAVVLLLYGLLARPRLGSAQLLLTLLAAAVLGLVLLAFGAFGQIAIDLPM